MENGGYPVSGESGNFQNIPNKFENHITLVVSDRKGYLYEDSEGVPGGDCETTK